MCGPDTGADELSRPDPTPGHRIGVLISSDEVKVYANRAGLLTLARQLVWIANSPPDENYELHTALHLRPEVLKNETVVFAKDDSVPCIDIEPCVDPDGQSGTFGFDSPSCKFRRRRWTNLLRALSDHDKAPSAFHPSTTVAMLLMVAISHSAASSLVNACSRRAITAGSFMKSVRRPGLRPRFW